MTVTETQVVNDFLAGRDASCPVCRYNLRDLQGPMCPECGTVVGVAVIAPHAPPYRRTVKILLLCAAAALLYNLVLVWYWLIFVTRPGVTLTPELAARFAFEIARTLVFAAAVAFGGYALLRGQRNRRVWNALVPLAAALLAVSFLSNLAFWILSLVCYRMI